MKKIIIIIFGLMVIATGCSKTESSLKCSEYIDNQDCLVFVYKDDCKYCKNDYYYVNQVYQDNEAGIFSYCLTEKNKSINGVEISSVPCLVKVNNGKTDIVATGYIQVKRYLNNLK